MVSFYQKRLFYKYKYEELLEKTEQTCVFFPHKLGGIGRPFASTNIPPKIKRRLYFFFHVRENM